MPFHIPNEQVPVDLSSAELKRGQQDDVQCKRWHGLLETWKAGGAQARDMPAEAREFVLTDDGVLVRLEPIGEEGQCEILRPVAPVSLPTTVHHEQPTCVGVCGASRCGDDVALDSVALLVAEDVRRN